MHAPLDVKFSSSYTINFYDMKRESFTFSCVFCELETSYTECVSGSGDFAILFFFLVQQHWGGFRYCHFAANFKAF